MPRRDGQHDDLGAAAGDDDRGHRLGDAAGRLARFLLELSESKSAADGAIELPGLKRHVASQLNLTSETFSRTLRRLIEAGLVAELDAGRVRLLQPKKLRQVADGLFPTL